MTKVYVWSGEGQTQKWLCERRDGGQEHRSLRAPPLSTRSSILYLYTLRACQLPSGMMLSPRAPPQAQGHAW